MSRLSVSRETLIALFAKSGNVCAFPGCNHELVTARNIFVGQICHIEAANEGGQRYNPESADEYRRSFGNLMLFCYRHHKETDDVCVYTVQTLKTMKHEHESKYGQKFFKVNEAVLHRLETEMEAFWSTVSEQNRTAHIAPEFRVPIKAGIPATAQFVELYKGVERLAELLLGLAETDKTLNKEIRDHLESLGYDLEPYDAIPYYKNPFFSRNWEIHSIAINNSLADLVVSLQQAEVRFLEEYLKTHSNESAVSERLEAAKSKLYRMAISAGYAD